MTARRNRPSPYEIMTRCPPGHQVRPSHEPKDQDLAPPGAAKRHWWSQLRDPMIFRLPRGYILLLGAALVGLIMLAFWTGQNIGYRRGFRDSEAKADASLPLRDTGMAAVPAGAPLGASSGRVRIILEPSMQLDPRQSGMNYLVLAHLAEQEAQRLLNFLWDQEVDAAAVRGHNTQLYQVVALRGFTADQLDNAAADYAQHLAALGRLWKQKYGGADFAKNGIYPDKYKGERVAAIMTRGVAR